MTQKVATKRKMKSRQQTTSLGYFDSDGKAVNTREVLPYISYIGMCRPIG